MENYTKKFNESFLIETPEKILVGQSMFANIIFDVSELLGCDMSPVVINKNMACIILSSVAYYWLNDGYIYNGDIDRYVDSIQVAVAVNKTGYNYTVSQVGKRPGTHYSPAMLYLGILESGKVNNLRLSSDKVMSVGGLSIWKKILKNHHLSYYDADNPTSLNLIKDEEHLLSLFGAPVRDRTKDTDYRRFQYVLSETKLDFLDCKSLFSMREIRRLAGYPDSDL